MVFPQLGEHYLNEVAMFSLIPGECQDVISVDQNKMVEVFSEHLIHKSLALTRLYDPVFIATSKDHKSGLLFVDTQDPDVGAV